VLQNTAFIKIVFEPDFIAVLKDKTRLLI
jgi:hypothetical protein